MFKKAILMLSALTFAGHVYAGSMVVRLEAPKSPTNLTSLNLTFVTLDYASNGAITAKCYKKAPSDGGFSQFGNDIAITSGGNTETCIADMNADGQYQFYVTAQNASETATSDTVSVTKNTSGPGTPTNYNKSRINACDDKITFRSADDGGKTVKVEVYRSTNTNFSADGSTRFDTITIGSNTDGSTTVTPPGCNQYYYAVRAFDSAGNGSGLVGDSITVTTNVTVVTTPAAAGAIPVSGRGGNILGAESDTPEGATEASGAILGEATPSATPASPQTASQGGPTRTPWYIGGALLVILFVVWLVKRKNTAQ